MTLATLLSRLGGNPDLVAESLRRLGHTGVPHDECQCPVAKYLQANGYPEATVNLSFAHGCDIDRPKLLPEAVALFIDAFDDGLYPELIA